MKKSLLAATAIAVAIFMQSCRTEPVARQSVQFDLLGLTVSTDAMDAPRRSTTPSSANMTDIWVMEGATLLAHQVSTDQDFGSPTIGLTYGQHSLTFIASDQAGQSVTDGIFSAQNAKNCFAKVYDIDVTATTEQASIVLERTAYAIKWSSTDPVPDEATQLRLTINPCHLSLTPSLTGTGGQAKSQTYDITSYHGSPISVTAYAFPAAYKTETQVTTTIDFLDADGTTLYTYAKQVPVLTNRRTIISGAFFGSTAACPMQINLDWLTDYETSL